MDSIATNFSQLVPTARKTEGYVYSNDYNWLAQRMGDGTVMITHGTRNLMFITPANAVVSLTAHPLTTIEKVGINVILKSVGIPFTWQHIWEPVVVVQEPINLDECVPFTVPIRASDTVGIG